MNNQIKVSVIIPVYQVENYLERAIDSVLAQTLEEKEMKASARLISMMEVMMLPHKFATVMHNNIPA